MSDTNNTNGTENVPMHIPVPLVGTHHSHVGPMLGVLVIMLALILGGLFLWGSELDKQAQTVEETPVVNNEPETVRANTDTQILETLSPSDDISAIDADLSSTNFDSLDTDLTAIDAEMNASLSE